MAEVRIPGSKSITARALFLGACSSGLSYLQRPLLSDDTEAFALPRAILPARDLTVAVPTGGSTTGQLSIVRSGQVFPEDDADHVVEHIAADPEMLLTALAGERLSTSEDGLKVPWISATSGALSTALGATIPIVPFFFMSGTAAVVTAAIVSLIAHFAVGAAKSLITVRSWWSSGFEMTAVGAVEGAVTYAIGLWLGHLGA